MVAAEVAPDMIRAATMADRQAILGIVVPWLELYPLTPDRPKMLELLTNAISSAQHFCWVAEGKGGVGGVLIGLTSDNLWARKKNCNIVAWISDIPGEGASLLRKFREFVKSRPGIRVAGACPDVDVDSRAWQLAERIGFKRHGGAYLLFAG